jgi:hypothetical protein
MTMDAELNTQEDVIARLAQELEQAIRWNRPAILIIVCSSAKVRKEMQDRVVDFVQSLGQTIAEYFVAPATYDIPLVLSQHPGRSKTVFFVSRLNRGGGTGNRNAFRALNMRRELLVDHPTRVVFWLTRSEAKSLALLAPDFWAFRHLSLAV